jgi:hypothetical protein
MMTFMANQQAFDIAINSSDHKTAGKSNKQFNKI